MKRQAIALALVGAMTAGLLAGCGSTGAPAGNGGSASAEAPKGDGANGSVYYLNFKPEADQAWQDLAAAYTDQTGVPVTVVTAASGNYETTLMSEMGKSEAPTLFQVNGPSGLANWQDYCLDLSDSEIYSHLTNDSYTLKTEDGAVAGIAYVIESYGLITNVKLLEQAGYTVDDIQSFDQLKAVAEDITARSAELGFAAFTSPGMDGSSDWRFKTHLANLPIYFEYQADGIDTTTEIKGTYLDNYRAMWDLYTNNTTCAPTDISAKTGDDSETEFLEGKAVFFQNGSWEYSNLVTNGSFTDEDVVMLPIYIGCGDEANQGLCTGSENFWCVNAEADEDDIQATLDFLNWCVSSEEGASALANDMGFVIPFDTAVETPNVFVQQDAAYTAAGKTPVSWNFTTMPSEEWKNGVGSALTAYAAAPSDDTWADVVSAFVDGWAIEYSYKE